MLAQFEFNLEKPPSSDPLGLTGRPCSGQNVRRNRVVVAR
jgi:hypothetical protein